MGEYTPNDFYVLFSLLMDLAFSYPMLSVLVDMISRMFYPRRPDFFRRTPIRIHTMTFLFLI